MFTTNHLGQCSERSARQTQGYLLLWNQDTSHVLWAAQRLAFWLPPTQTSTVKTNIQLAHPDTLTERCHCGTDGSERQIGEILRFG